MRVERESRERVRVEKEFEKRRSASREKRERESREGVRVEKERVEKECE